MSSYKALYRKYRPQLFSDVIDQEHVTRTLQNAIRLGHISHAYLFNGPRGIGKTTIARIFAKAINCLNPNDAEPCGECEVCKSITDSSNPDIIEIDAASRTRVEQMREMLERTSFLPTMSKYKVYIIDEVHMLSQSSFNALLKTLEEPPAHVIFILCTTEVEKVIPTIRSRCQRFDFHLIDKNAMIEHLRNISEEENISIKDEAISLIAEAAEGGMRDALSLLDQVSSFSLNEEITEEDVLMVTGKLSTSILIDIAGGVYRNDSSETINTLSSLLKAGKEVERITQDLISFYKDILVIKNTNRDIQKVGYDLDEFKLLTKQLSNNQLYSYIENLTSAMTDFRFSTNKRLYLELALIKMCGQAPQKEPQYKEVEKANQYDPNKVYSNPFIKKEEPKVEEVVVKPQEIEETIEEQQEIVQSETQTEKIQDTPIYPNEQTSLEETIIEVPEIVEEVPSSVESSLVFEEEENDSNELEVPEVKIEPSTEIEYDIHFIEEILNNSDKPFKESIIEKLSKAMILTKGTYLHKYSIMLDGSIIRASSRGAFILTFDVVGQCNLVMKEENAKGIKELVQKITGYDLSFIAIPQNLWDALSNEYVGIYKTNAKNNKMEYISLTPIPCPGLITEKSKKPIEHDNKYKDLEDLFGEDFIKIK